jgi:sugar phosphate permease
MKLRWWICLLIFATWLMSYIDRSLMPMALPLIEREFHLSPIEMGSVMSAFFLGYASMQVPGGLIADRIGPRKAMTLGIAAWSVFTFLTGMASSLINLLCVRVLFGLCEGIHPPAAFKMLASWFMSRERARANGIVMSSNTLGPMIAPLLFAVIVSRFGWRSSFFIVAIPGIVLTLLAYKYLRDKPAEYPGITASELAEIGTDDCSQQKMSFVQLLKWKALWKLFFVYLTWDMTWWGFQAWLPSYLIKERGFKLLGAGVVTSLPFAAGFIGTLLAGYISDRTGRRKSVLIIVLVGNAVFMMLTATAVNVTWAIVFLVATGLFLPAIHGPFWSLTMDLLPSEDIGFCSGLINTGGQIAGILAPFLFGVLIQLTGHYYAGFLSMSVAAGLAALFVATLNNSGSSTRAPILPAPAE